ncbi:MAG: hypothetical protein AAF959_07540 [Cyanobacteria bacterium P01_D01_bin.56]
MAQVWLNDFQGTKWQGKAELWLNPDSNDAEISDCTLTVESNVLAYTWSYKGETKTGSFTFYEGDATWVDSWHQTTPVQCADLLGAWGLFTVQYSYGDSPAWGWCSKLSQRPDGSLVLQMTNIAPWGEEGRAVRMVLKRSIKEPR